MKGREDWRDGGGLMDRRHRIGVEHVERNKGVLGDSSILGQICDIVYDGN